VGLQNAISYWPERIRAGGGALVNRILRALLMLGFCGFPLPTQTPHTADSGIAGTWEGESNCTVPSSPGRNEHVMYNIPPARDSAGGSSTKDGAGKWKIDGYKIVAGEKQFMGTLECTYRAAKKTLRCSSGDPNHDDWLFTVEGQAMEGTLKTDGGKTLYRKITLHQN
jgi:hypothetical protein